MFVKTLEIDMEIYIFLIPEFGKNKSVTTQLNNREAQILSTIIYSSKKSSLLNSSHTPSYIIIEIRIIII